jgi:hypothetical protein
VNISFRFSEQYGLAIGAVGLTALGLQPQLLDAARVLGLSSDRAGLFCTAEIAAMALSALCGFAWLCGRRRRPVLVAAAAAMAAGHAISGVAQQPLPFLLGRLVAGGGEGLMATAAMLSILASAAPVRSSALFIGLTAVPQILVTALLGWLPYGSVSPALAVLGLTAIPLAWPPGPALRIAPPSWPSPRAAAAIGLTALLNMIGSACWTYLDAWRLTILPGDAWAAQVIPLCLLAQIGASLLTALRGPDRTSLAALTIILLGEAIAVWAIGQAGSGLALLAAALLFGFAWQAGLPLATGLFARLDPSLGAACLMLPVGLAAIAAGPALAAMLPPAHLHRLFATAALALTLAAFALAGHAAQRRYGWRRAYS